MNIRLYIIFLMATSSAYTQPQEDPNKKISFSKEKNSTPRRTASTGVVIHKQSSNFIDIEAPVERVWISCSPTDTKSDVSHFGVDIEDENVNYSFIPRRAVDDVPSCLAKMKEYKAMMKGAKSVRVVGDSLMVYEYVKPPKGYKNDDTPLRFRNRLKRISSFFVRLQVGEKCKSHFPDDCELPKNYWAGTFPVE